MHYIYAMLGKIGLSGLAFRAYHGVFPEEQLHGNDFVVDCTIEASFPESGDRLADVVDYSGIYTCIQARMNERYDLLETLSRVICQDILAMDVRISAVRIRITKSQQQRWGKGAASFAELYLPRHA